jgi:hypothetical protein
MSKLTIEAQYYQQEYRSNKITPVGDPTKATLDQGIFFLSGGLGIRRNESKSTIFNPEFNPIAYILPDDPALNRNIQEVKYNGNNFKRVVLGEGDFQLSLLSGNLLLQIRGTNNQSD